MYSGAIEHNHMNHAIMEIWNKDSIRKLNMEEKNDWVSVFEDHNDILIERERYLSSLNMSLYNPYFLSYFIVKNESNKIVATAKVIDKNGYYFIEEISTHKEFRRNGFGLFVLDAITNYLKRISVHKIYSHVDVDNRIAIDLLLKYGFSVVSEMNNELVLYYKIS